jgi:hypothetical protein
MVVAAILKLGVSHLQRVRDAKLGTKSLVGDFVHIVAKSVSSADFPAQCGRNLLVLVQYWCCFEKVLLERRYASPV